MSSIKDSQSHIHCPEATIRPIRMLTMAVTGKIPGTHRVQYSLPKGFVSEIQVFMKIKGHPGHPSCEGALFCFGAKKASISPILFKEKCLWRVAAA